MIESDRAWLGVGGIIEQGEVSVGESCRSLVNDDNPIVSNVSSACETSGESIENQGCAFLTANIDARLPLCYSEQAFR